MKPVSWMTAGLLLLMQGVTLAAGAAADPVAAVIADYQAVRKVAMALAAIGFLLGVARLGTTEMPGERHRAEGLVVLTAFTFLLLAGDRIIAQGVATWFGLPASGLPVFWQ